jgi:hypothetical protein
VRASPIASRRGRGGRPRLAEQLRHGVVADRLEVLVVLQDRPERLLDDLRVELLGAKGHERVRPVDRLRDAGRLGEVHLPQPGHERRGLGGQPLRDARHPQPHDLDLALQRRVRDPVEQAAALERVVQLAGAVRREDHRRPPLGRDRPDLRDRDLEVGEDLQEERLELVVGPVDLVDEQHDRVLGGDGLQQRAADEELGAEELLLVDRPLLRRADVQELARVVPLVDRVGDVQALVALQADQARAHRAGQGLGRLGLADARLALQQQGLLDGQREEQRGRQAALREVPLTAQRVLDLGDGSECPGGAHGQDPNHVPGLLTARQSPRRRLYR